MRRKPESLLVERRFRIDIGAVEIDMGEPERPVGHFRTGLMLPVAMNEAQDPALRLADRQDRAAVGTLVRAGAGQDPRSMLNDVVGDHHEIIGRRGSEGHREDLGPAAAVEREDVVIRPGRAKVDSFFIPGDHVESPDRCIEALRQRQIRRADVDAAQSSHGKARHCGMFPGRLHVTEFGIGRCSLLPRLAPLDRRSRLQIQIWQGLSIQIFLLARQIYKFLLLGEH